jgi:pyruvate, water dikinase
MSKHLSSPRATPTADPIAWFDTLSRSDVARVGGKGANLAEMTRAGLPVPPGFVVTAQAFLMALDGAGVRKRLYDLFAAVDPNDVAGLARISSEASDVVRTVAWPPELDSAFSEALARLGADAPVAVRSSATSEDTASTSFAGMHETFTHVMGRAAVIEKVRACWASAYGQRVLAYRKAQGMTEEPAIAVVIQKMVSSARSGVLFTADPASGDTTRIIVEGAFGLGEVVVGGQVEPDTYTLSKEGPCLLEARVGRKSFKIVRGPDGADARVELKDREATRRVLSDDEAVELARLALTVEQHYGAPQDIEWAEAEGKWYLVQTRPITTLGAAGHGELLVSGLGASPGSGHGNVRVLRSPEEGSQLKNGEVLVAPMTSPDWVPTIRRASALVTDSGGVTCHAAIVSRELRIPCVVGTRTATQLLRTGELVTVDGSKGRVTAGFKAHEAPSAPQVQPAAAASLALRKPWRRAYT